MISSVLLSDDPALVDRVRAASDDSGLTAITGPLPKTPAELFARLAQPLAGVVLIDARTESGAALHLAAQLTANCPGLGQVIIGPEALALPALRAGVSDLCSPEADVDALRRSITWATRPSPASSSVPARAPGRLISVVSPKGGVGKTTVATNIAVGLSLRDPHSTVIVDLDVQFGDVASALDLEPEFFLGETVRGASRNDAMVLKTFLTQHRTGLYAICAPPSPEQADELTADDISGLLRTLKSQFRYVVVDTAPGLSEHTLAALDETTDPVLVTSMDVPGVRGLRKELQTLATLNLLPERRQLVLNFADRKNLLTLADVEATIEDKIDIALPRSRAALSSVNQGVPLLESRQKDPLTRGLDLLVDRLCDRTAAGTGARPSTARGRARKNAKASGPQPRRAAQRWRRAASGEPKPLAS